MLGYLKRIGKCPQFEPGNPLSALKFKIIVRAVCCRPLAGYMDSKVVERHYTIGIENGQIADPNQSKRP